MKRTLVLFALLGAVAGGSRAQDPAPARADFAALLPADTLFAVSGTDLGEEFRKDSALGRLWAEPEVQRFFT